MSLHVAYVFGLQQHAEDAQSKMHPASAREAVASMKGVDARGHSQASLFTQRLCEKQCALCFLDDVVRG